MTLAPFAEHECKLGLGGLAEVGGKFCSKASSSWTKLLQDPLGSWGSGALYGQWDIGGGSALGGQLAGGVMSRFDFV